jgi:rhodanese-related sulfurtransferase
MTRTNEIEREVAARTITTDQVTALLAAGRMPDLIDVRTPGEFAAARAQGATNVPLDQLDPKLLIARRGASDEPIYLICKSGARASKAARRFCDASFPNVVCIDGGMTAWEQAGLPVVRGRGVISLERQVRIAAGVLVLIGVTLGWLVHPGFLGVAAFVGAGLVFAGVTDWCGMAMLLARMPWNRRTACQR